MSGCSNSIVTGVQLTVLGKAFTCSVVSLFVTLIVKMTTCLFRLGHSWLKMSSPIKDVKVCCKTYLEIRQQNCVKVWNPNDFCEIYLEIMEIMTKFYGIPVLETTNKGWNSNLLYIWGRALFIWKSPNLKYAFC